MTVTCHECQDGVGNPYYNASLFVYDSELGKTAFSRLGTTLCNREREKVNQELRVHPGEVGKIGIVLDTMTGTRGGLLGKVQLSGSHEARGQYRYLDYAVAEKNFPNSVHDLFRELSWVEPQKDGSWKEISWATEFYNRLRNID